jgi:hypothetical protein
MMWQLHATAQIPGPMIGVPVDDNLPQLIATGNVNMVDGEVLPALARAKNTAQDRQVYREHDGKLVVVVNGFVIARKGPHGTWSVPTNPTRWAGPPAKAPGTSVVTGEEAAEVRQQARNREEWGQQFWDAKDATQYDLPEHLQDTLASLNLQDAKVERPQQALPAERDLDPLDVEIAEDFLEAAKEKVKQRRGRKGTANYLEHGPEDHPGDI